MRGPRRPWSGLWARHDRRWGDVLSSAPPQWVAREPPLAPVAAAAVGEVARALLTALAGRTLDGLTGVVSYDPLVVVILGEAKLLPWVDGIAYLGRDSVASGLMLPTTRRPAAPVDVFAAAVRARVPPAAWPVVALEDPCLLIPVGNARPLGRAELARAARR